MHKLEPSWMRWPDAEIERSVKIWKLCGSDQRDQADERSVLHETDCLHIWWNCSIFIRRMCPLRHHYGSSFLLSQLQETSWEEAEALDIRRNLKFLILVFFKCYFGRVYSKESKSFACDKSCFDSWWVAREGMCQSERFQLALKWVRTSRIDWLLNLAPL